MENIVDNLFDLDAVIEINEQLILRPIIVDFLTQEAVLYTLISESSGIKEHLPQFYIADEAAAVGKLLEHIEASKAGKSILYSIRFKDFLAPIGYVYMEAPTAKEENWTFDVWISGMMQGKGIMTKVLKRLEPILKENGITHFVSYVPKGNHLAKKIAEKVGFVLEKQEGDIAHFKYHISA